MALGLKADTPAEWVKAVLAHFDTFLQDHASCERKASAMAMSLVAHYHDRPELVSEMVELAREELDHFARVYQHLRARGLHLAADEKDTYVRQLLALVRPKIAEEYLLDRLLIAGIVEARGCERFSLIAQALDPGPLKDFYLDITRSEARHHGLFVRLARVYAPESIVNERLAYLLDQEARIMRQLPIRPIMH